MPDYVWLISTCQGSGMNNQTHKELRMRWWRRTSTTNCSPCTTDVAPTIWMRNVLWFLSPQQNQLFTVLRSDVVPSYHGKSMHRAKRYHIVYNLILMSHVLIWFYTCFSLQVPRRINGDSQRWDFSFDSIWSICSFAPRNVVNKYPKWSSLSPHVQSFCFWQFEHYISFVKIRQDSVLLSTHCSVFAEVTF